jgi:hypothetical protein
MYEDQQPIKTFNWGKEPIQLEFPDEIGYEFRPVQVHLKEDGSLKNQPSFCIVLHHPTVDRYVYGQISLEMANDVLGRLGMKIVKLVDGEDLNSEKQNQ